MFWERFKVLCESAGMTPNGVAKKIGLSSATVTYWSKGTKPTYESIKRVADFFNVPIESLMGNDDAQPQAAESSLNAEARSLIDDVELLHKNPELRVLLSASSKLTKDDLAVVTEIAKRMNRERDNE